MFAVFAALHAFCFWSWRSRIPFSVLMLQTTIDVSRTVGHVFAVSAVGGLIALFAGAWFAVTAVAVATHYNPKNDPRCGQNCSNATPWGLLAFTVFSFYWLSEVIKNVMHVSTCGVYGSWFVSLLDGLRRARTDGGRYYCSRTRMPSHPTIGALKRAMTYSFGSICFGSLMLAIVQMLAKAASIASQSEAIQGNVVGYVLWVVAKCILALVESLVAYFNVSPSLCLTELAG